MFGPVQPPHRSLSTSSPPILLCLNVTGRGMRFAERQLLRHGWQRGRGLGKREDGIAEAIRVRVKCDTAGLGHDAAEPFSFHWWDHVFNASAANIAVEAAQVPGGSRSPPGTGVPARAVSWAHAGGVAVSRRRRGRGAT
uniref:G patch domain-containing protein 4 n=1 Tax=Nothoprocta perdicaria TaxID=30464 RepID=A0A8C7E9J4_NOTPE